MHVDFLAFGMNTYKPLKKTNSLQKQVTYSIVDNDKLSLMNKNHNKGFKVNATKQYCVTHWYYDLLECSVFFCVLPVVEQYIGTFDVSVKEVVLMAVV